MKRCSGCNDPLPRNCRTFCRRCSWLVPIPSKVRTLARIKREAGLEAGKALRISASKGGVA